MQSIVCGIDPGLGATGYAVIRTESGGNGLPCGGRDVTVLDAGVCHFNRAQSLPDRLCALHTDIAAILNEHRPVLVAVEQLYSHYNHPRTAILMGHARGVILQAAASAGIEVRSYSATRIKRFLTGNGRAGKAQMQRAVQVTLNLPSLPEPPDVADAIAVALCAAADVGHCHPERGEGSRRGIDDATNRYAGRQSRHAERSEASRIRLASHHTTISEA